jgi:CBS domain-containing protein
MKCADLMSVDLRVLPTTATVHQAATVMRNESVGFLPICDEAGRVAGVLTDRDIATRAAAANSLPSLVLVTEVMTRPALVCGEREEVSAAEGRMIDEGVARLVVVDDGGAPVGVVSLTDVLNGRPKGRAVEVARGVLAREAAGPHFPVQEIRLTPETLPVGVGPEAHEESYRAAGFEAVLAGGEVTRSMKEFPR